VEALALAGVEPDAQASSLEKSTKRSGRIGTSGFSGSTEVCHGRSVAPSHWPALARS
jgi:hypothetical protein